MAFIFRIKGLLTVSGGLGDTLLDPVDFTRGYIERALAIATVMDVLDGVAHHHEDAILTPLGPFGVQIQIYKIDKLFLRGRSCLLIHRLVLITLYHRLRLGQRLNMVRFPLGCGRL
jgi:hypothetical protein